MALDVEPIAQAQRPEFLLGKLAREVTARLVAELRDPRIDERLIELIVPVHAAGTIGGAFAGAKYRVVWCTSFWGYEAMQHYVPVFNGPNPCRDCTSRNSASGSASSTWCGAR